MNVLQTKAEMWDTSGAGKVGHLIPAPVVVARRQCHGGRVGVGAKGLARGRRVHRRPKARQIAGEQVTAEADPVEDPRPQTERVDHIEETNPETDYLAEASTVEAGAGPPGYAASPRPSLPCRNRALGRRLCKKNRCSQKALGENCPSDSGSG